MTQSEVQAELSRLDIAWQKLTGQSFKDRGVVNWREEPWMRFRQAGWTVRDLEIVVLHLKAKIRAGERHPECLSFRRLICNLDVFEDEAHFAQGERRNAKPAPTDKEKVMQAFRPTTGEAPSPGTAKQSKEVIAALIAAMRQQAL